MKLKDISEKTPLVKDFVKQLGKFTKQAVLPPVLNKIKRLSGVSVLPIDLNLENGQVVTIYLRIIDDHPDIFRIDVNGRQMPTTGDFDNSYKPAFNLSVNEVGTFVLRGQSEFDKKRASIKVKPVKTNRNTSVSMANKLESLNEQILELDKQIEQKEMEKTTLIRQLASLEGND